MNETDFFTFVGLRKLKNKMFSGQLILRSDFYTPMLHLRCHYQISLGFFSCYLLSNFLYVFLNNSNNGVLVGNYTLIFFVIGIFRIVHIKLSNLIDKIN
jgi:hypothetical protein